MTERFITHAFIAGELDTPFFGRTDLEKYDLGVAEATNFFVDFRGGLKSRPGTALIDELDGKARIFPFQYNDEGEDALLVFGDETLHIYIEGELVEDGGSPLEIATPYATADLPHLVYHYHSFSAVLTMNGKAPHELSYDDTAGWSLAPISMEPSIGPPANVTMITRNDSGASATGSARTVVVVTSVNADGEESRPSIPQVMTSLRNYTAIAGSGVMSWDAVAGAVKYRVYRAIIAENVDITRGQQVGYIGETRGTRFVDVNIIPDFTLQPPNHFNPFASGAILGIDVTAAGSGYNDNATVSIADGTGFVGYPIVEGGEIVGVVVLNGGSGYTTGSAVTFAGGGSGATATITAVSPAGENFPAATTLFQQRRLYAGQRRAPLALYGSKPGSETNFDSSPVPNDGDAYAFVLDGSGSSPISYLEPIRDGLLIFHRENVQRLMASEGKAVTPINFSFEEQTPQGSAAVAPLKIDSDILYAARRGRSLIALVYTFYTNSFTAQDVSVLAPHIFDRGRVPLRIEWVAEPDKLVWVLRRDGTLACLTYMREQEIYGWSQHYTRGNIIDICTVRDSAQDTLYLVVERWGSTFLEALQPRRAAPVDEYWGLDCALRYEGTRQSTWLRVVPTDETTATLLAGDDVFTGAEGWFVRGGQGLYRIDEVVSASEATATIIRPAFDFCGCNSRIRDPHWFLAEAVDNVSGLAHLNGRTVGVLADGDYLGEFVVEDGALTFDRPYSMIVVGLPYECRAKTLPLTIPDLQTDGRKKRPVGTAVRVHETRGLEIGIRELFEMRDPFPDEWGELKALRSDTALVLLKSRWQRDQQLRFRQRYPLPATILGLVTEAEVDE